jgi:hypothetical protein
MKQPIPRNGTEPLKVGDSVRIVPEWQDPGDDRFETFVIEAPENCTQVRIRTIIPGFAIHPTEWIEADKLVLISPETNQPQPPTMKTTIKDNVLHIEIPLHAPRPSATGKTLTVASSKGNQPTEATINGKPVIVGVNAYIQPLNHEHPVQLHQGSLQAPFPHPPSQGHAAGPDPCSRHA